ncbi:unnamed protein product [Urochloa humidicola]
MAAAAATTTASFPSTRRTRDRAWARPSLVSLRSRSLKVNAAAEPAPAFQSVTAFAPATVANLGPGFDFLGCAVADASLSLGDTVTATLDPTLPPATVSIASVTSPSRPHLAARLSKDPLRNCAGVAAIAALRALGVRSHAVSIHLTKGLPLGSGLGSSAASAAAAAKAVDALFGSRLPSDDLVLAGLESEKAVSGFHADNIAPAILGGFVLVRSYDPFHLVPLASPPALRLHFVLVTPDFEAPTGHQQDARRAAQGGARPPARAQLQPGRRARRRRAARGRGAHRLRHVVRRHRRAHQGAPHTWHGGRQGGGAASRGAGLHHQRRGAHRGGCHRQRGQGGGGCPQDGGRLLERRQAQGNSNRRSAR